MKKITFALIITIPLLVFGCKKVKDLLTFDFDINQNVTIPSTVIVSVPLDIATPNITTSSQQNFDNNNTNKDKVKDIKITKLNLEMVSPGQTFDFLESIHLYISADGLPEKEIAFADNIPNTGLTVVSTTTTGDDLDEYIKKDAFSLRTKVTTDQTITQDTEIKVAMSFRVTADPL